MGPYRAPATAQGARNGALCFSIAVIDLVRLPAASYGKFDELGIDISVVGWWVDLLDRHFNRAREELGQELADGAWEEGTAMSWDAALEYACDLAAD
jgi:hypothetical protein